MAPTVILGFIWKGPSVFSDDQRTRGVKTVVLVFGNTQIQENVAIPPIQSLDSTQVLTFKGKSVEAHQTTISVTADKIKSLTMICRCFSYKENECRQVMIDGKLKNQPKVANFDKSVSLDGNANFENESFYQIVVEADKDFQLKATLVKASLNAKEISTENKGEVGTKKSELLTKFESGDLGFLKLLWQGSFNDFLVPMMTYLVKPFGEKAKCPFKSECNHRELAVKVVKIELNKRLNRDILNVFKSRIQPLLKALELHQHEKIVSTKLFSICCDLIGSEGLKCIMQEYLKSLVQGEISESVLKYIEDFSSVFEQSFIELAAQNKNNLVKEFQKLLAAHLLLLMNLKVMEFRQQCVSKTYKLKDKLDRAQGIKVIANEISKIDANDLEKVHAKMILAGKDKIKSAEFEMRRECLLLLKSEGLIEIMRANLKALLEPPISKEVMAVIENISVAFKDTILTYVGLNVTKASNDKKDS